MIASSPRRQPPESSSVVAGVCVLSAVVFCVAFFQQQLPNNPSVNRTEIWGTVLDAVLQVDPPAAADPPAGAISRVNALQQRLPIAARALLLLGLAWTTGALTVRLTGVSRWLVRTECLMLELGVGLLWLSLTTLLAGLCGMLSSWVLALPSVLSAVLLIFLRFRRGMPPVAGAASTSPRPGIRNLHRGRQLLTTAIFVGGAVWFSYLFLAAMSPPIDFDVREYHLQGPKEWFLAGRITFLQHNVYTSFPFLTEMLSLAGMTVANDWWIGALTGKVVLAVFAPLTTLCVYHLGRRLADQTAALLAAVIHATTPWTMRISIIAYAEGGLTFYLAAAFFCLLLLLQTEPHHDERERRTVLGHRGLLLITGLLAGSAMACKYTGLVSVVLPVLAGVMIFSRLGHGSIGVAPPDMKLRRGRTCAWHGVVIYGTGVVLAVGPWLLRNLHDTGNPVYPLAYGLFGGAEWSSSIDLRWKAAHSAPEHSLARIPQHFLDVALRNDWTSPLLWALAIPSLLLARCCRSLRLMWIMTTWQFLIWWALTHRIDRFWIPAIPLLAASAGMAWKLSSTRLWRGGMLVLVVLATVFNIRFCTLPLIGFNAGLMDLNVARQIPIRADFQHLNRTLPPDSRVLMVGEAEVFDAHFSLLYNTVFDDSLFEQLVASGDPPRLRDSATIRQALQDAGVTHVMVNWFEILRYRQPGSYGYTPFVQPAVLTELVAGGVLKQPEILLSRPLSAFSAQELEIWSAWDGSEVLRQPESAQVSGVLLYAVQP